MDTSMARYILSIFSHYQTIVWSWGFNTAIALENGLQFTVSGMIFKGKVRVLYDEGSDTFKVQLIKKGVIVKEVVDVYLDCLVNVIDGMVEKCENYAQKVMKII